MKAGSSLSRTSRVAALLAAVLLGTGCTREPPAEAGAATVRRPSAPSASPSPDHSAFVAWVDALAADAVRSGPIAGLSIAVVSHGHDVLVKGYGLADVEARAPATADTSYPIASVSKTFTAAAILRLVDQGRLGLDDPLSRFFPDARPAIGSLTIRHLLEHTSGLTVGGPAPRRAAVSVLARGGTGRPQGQDWTYSNYNYSLLGLVLEQASGRDYASFVRDEIAAPVGLTGTGTCEEGEAVAGRGRDYLSGRGTLAETDYWRQPRFFAAGALCSTVRDLVRFMSALEAGRVVSPAARASMWEPARLPSGLRPDYGLGTRLGYTGDRRKVGHTGGGQGNKAVLARYPDEQLTVVVLLNTERPGAAITATSLEEKIARRFLELPEPGTPAAPSRAVAHYAGEYRHGSRKVHVEVDGAGLRARPGLARRTVSRLVAQGGDAFVDADQLSHAVRFQFQDGRPLGYARYSNGWFSGLTERGP
jgi:D-alanyl-D-alanine carboxypeptidase